MKKELDNRDMETHDAVDNEVQSCLEGLLAGASIKRTEEQIHALVREIVCNVIPTTSGCGEWPGLTDEELMRFYPYIDHEEEPTNDNKSN